jgi:hypothetical protein
MGKGLAEFRKASDDFKRTWEREVALETPDEQMVYNPPELHQGDEANLATADENVPDPLEPANPEWVVPRDGSPYEATPETVEATSGAAPEAASEAVPVPAEATQPEPLRKHDWL